MIKNLLIGRPGISTLSNAIWMFCFTDGTIAFLPGGRIVDGTAARDPGNTDDPLTLRPGLPMGKLNSNGRYANAFLGKTAAAVAAGATSFVMSPANAAELARRIGGTGNVTIVGPPAASGTVAAQTVAVTAVNAATGVVTATVPAAVVADSVVTAADGSGVPLTVVGDGYGLILPAAGVDAEFPRFPIGGVIEEPRLIDWPTDPSSRAYFRSQLSSLAGGKFTFSNQY